MKTKKRNPKLWLMCGQHVNASDDKCPDLKGHCVTEWEYELSKRKTQLRVPTETTPYIHAQENEREAIAGCGCRLDVASDGPALYRCGACIRAVESHNKLVSSLRLACEVLRAKGEKGIAVCLEDVVAKAKGVKP